LDVSYLSNKNLVKHPPIYPQTSIYRLISPVMLLDLSIFSPIYSWFVTSNLHSFFSSSFDFFFCFVLFLFLLHFHLSWFCFGVKDRYYSIQLILLRIRKMDAIVGNPLRLKSVNHISLICRSVAVTVAFYENVLGFISIVRPGSFNFEGAWYVTY